MTSCLVIFPTDEQQLAFVMREIQVKGMEPQVFCHDATPWRTPLVTW